jgi:hypothetical protein
MFSFEHAKAHEDEDERQHGMGMASSASISVELPLSFFETTLQCAKQHQCHDRAPGDQLHRSAVIA